MWAWTFAFPLTRWLLQDLHVSGSSHYWACNTYIGRYYLRSNRVQIPVSDHLHRRPVVKSAIYGAGWVPEVLAVPEGQYDFPSTGDGEGIA